MEVILYTIFIVACFVLIGVILLQPGKADAGAMFTSSISSTAFGPRGTQTLLAKITIGAASLFLLLALLLSLPGVTGPRSVVQGDAEAPVTAPQPQPPAVTTQPNADAGAVTTAPAQTAPAVEQPAAPANNQNPGATRTTPQP